MSLRGLRTKARLFMINSYYCEDESNLLEKKEEYYCKFIKYAEEYEYYRKKEHNDLALRSLHLAKHFYAKMKEIEYKTDTAA